MDKENKQMAMWLAGILWAVAAIGGLVNGGVPGLLGAAVGLPLFLFAYLGVAKLIGWLAKETGFYKPRTDYSDVIRETEAQQKREMEDLLRRTHKE